MFSSYPKYTSIPEDEDFGTAEDKRCGNVQTKRVLWVSFLNGLKSLLALSITANILMFTFMVVYISRHQRTSNVHNPFPQMLYSPVQDSLSYELKTFESAFNKNDFMGLPTPEINDRWKQLYRVGNSRITKSEAARLPNKTIAAIPGIEDDYLVVISVFHDLHCLDRLRQSLWYFYDEKWNNTHNPFTVPRPESFNRDGLNGIVHVDHCINIIRQSLQCFSDVTPYVFQWNEEAQEVRAYANVVHTCRNFDAVRDWARQRTYTGSWSREGYRDEQGACRSGDSGACLGM